MDRKFGPFQWLEAPNVITRKGYLAGTDPERSEGLVYLIEEGVDLLWAARGGFGCTRLSPTKVLSGAISRGIPMMGYSDLTALLIPLWSGGGKAFHGPMLGTDIARGGSDRTWESLEAFFSMRPERFVFAGEFIAGDASLEGTAVAGNIAVLASLAGTPSSPDLEGCVLFLEEVNEEPYRIDRSLTQILSSGMLDASAGVVFGSFRDCIPEEKEKSLSLDEVLEDFAERYGGTVVTGFPFGHGDENTVLPLGRKVGLAEEAGGILAEIG